MGHKASKNDDTGNFSYLQPHDLHSDNMLMMHNDKQPIFSPLIEHLMPDAPLAEQTQAQANLDAFMDVMYRIYTRLDSQGCFPFPDDGLTKL